MSVNKIPENALRLMSFFEAIASGGILQTSQDEEHSVNPISEAAQCMTATRESKKQDPRQKTFFEAHF